MQSPETPPRSPLTNCLLILGGCLVVFLCLACVALVGLAGYFYYEAAGESVAGVPTVTAESPVTRPPHQFNPTPTATPPPIVTAEHTVTAALTPTFTPSPPPLVQPPAAVVQSPVPAGAFDDLDRLFTAHYPPNDYFEAAVRLGRRRVGDRTVTGSPYTIGRSYTFYTDEGAVQATLMAMTEHAYFWVEEGLNVNQTAVTTAARHFEDALYPRLANLFGQPWAPGVDNDPRFSILHLVGSVSADELGYFTNVDEYPRALYSDSNEQEIVYLNMAQLDMGSDLYYGTLVHEVQHLIQWNVDANESTWLNEGLSQLAEIYLGFDTAGTVEYLRQPDIRLNSWTYDDDLVNAHYAGAYLYAVYLWEQLGEAAVQELARHPANGLASVRAVLQGYQPERSLEQFTADWAAANYLDDAAVGPAYAYRNLNLRRPTFQTRIKQLPFETVNELNQFGTHYIDLGVAGPVTITFAGDTVTGLIDTPPRSGSRFWLAPAMDDTNAQLTAAFDLSGLNRATLTFSAWYDLEEDWDFAYVSISTDGGQSWELLSPRHASAGAYGPAFNGRSDTRADAADGWVKESISLNSYTGRSVLLRFEVLTDSALLGQGFALDDIAIAELDYFTDAEAGPDGWEAQGFVQTGWQLPQQWSLQLIRNGNIPQVIPLPLNELKQGQWTVDLGEAGGVLVINPLTPFTDKPASYWLQIEP